MKKKVARKNGRLADDIRESLREVGNYFSGKTTKVIVHRVRPKETDARTHKMRRDRSAVGPQADIERQAFDVR